MKSAVEAPVSAHGSDPVKSLLTASCTRLGVGLQTEGRIIALSREQLGQNTTSPAPFNWTQSCVPEASRRGSRRFDQLRRRHAPASAGRSRLPGVPGLIYAAASRSRSRRGRAEVRETQGGPVPWRIHSPNWQSAGRTPCKVWLQHPLAPVANRDQAVATMDESFLWRRFRALEAATIFHVDLAQHEFREAEALDWLDEAEQSRRSRFVHPRPSREFTLCRAALRSLLCRELGCSNDDLSFGTSKFGKPFARVNCVAAPVAAPIAAPAARRSPRPPASGSVGGQRGCSRHSKGVG